LVSEVACVVQTLPTYRGMCGGTADGLAPSACFQGVGINATTAREQLHQKGWTILPDGMPEWELRRFVERMFRRHNGRLIQLLTEQKANWSKTDDAESGPGCYRPGGLVARLASQSMDATGIFVYAAHPSQAEDEEDGDHFSGPRWYVSCMEAAMRHYKPLGVAPLPPNNLRDILWPNKEDQCRPWLTEAGWTIVPDGSDPQVLHADICSPDGYNLREHNRGRYQHFAWKLRPSELCTTQVVSGAFTEGEVAWAHYKQCTIAQGRAFIFDSEMLHRGGPTAPGCGLSSTLTLQICSGSGWPHLKDKVDSGLMWYTQPLGWAVGDAVDAWVDDSWCPAFVESRPKRGLYNVKLEGKEHRVQGMKDAELRHRQGCADAVVNHVFAVGSAVDAQFEGAWCAAKVTKLNADGTYRVTWQEDRTCTDGLPASAVRRRKRKRLDASSIISTVSNDRCKRRCITSEGIGCADAVESVERLAVQRTLLRSQGWIELASGLPKSWSWPVFEFVEACHDMFNDLVISELDSLRHVWVPCENSLSRYGAFAAAKVSERLCPYGIAVYSPGESQEECSPYQSTGPRWYVSVTAKALECFGVAPPLPAALRHTILSPSAASEGEFRARGLGWALAPPGSDPQAIHADIWGIGKHEKTDETRWPHILWKRSASQFCTTQIVPGGFTLGAISEDSFSSIRQVRAPAIVVDSEVLHRGARTPPVGADSCAPLGWVSTLSIELCSPSGWQAWEEFSTGGTTKDPTCSLDWTMLRINTKPAPLQAPGECMAASPDALKSLAALHTAVAPILPTPFWVAEGGKERLCTEQKRWEHAM